MSGVTPLAIVGAGGFGREVAWLAGEINQERHAFEILGFIDDSASSTPEGYPILDTLDGWMRQGRRDVRLVCALGDSITRYRVATRLREAGHEFATLVHPTVRRSRWVEIGTGSMICAGNILTTNIAIGAHALINLDCTIGHDTVFGEFTSLMPGVHISGEVTTKTGVYFGTGAVVINEIEIGAWTIVGAGAVVSSNLPDAVIAVGVPAKAIKANTRAPERSPVAESSGA